LKGGGGKGKKGVGGEIIPVRQSGRKAGSHTREEKKGGHSGKEGGGGKGREIPPLIQKGEGGANSPIGGGRRKKGRKFYFCLDSEGGEKERKKSVRRGDNLVQKERSEMITDQKRSHGRNKKKKAISARTCSGKGERGGKRLVVRSLSQGTEKKKPPFRRRKKKKKIRSYNSP